MLSKYTNFALEKPKVFKDNISPLFFNFNNTHIEDMKIINGNILIKILGTIINDNAIGNNIPTS